jgi:UDP-N-acetyl-D-glucosamine dehydrogenase
MTVTPSAPMHRRSELYLVQPRAGDGGPEPPQRVSEPAPSEAGLLTAERSTFPFDVAIVGMGYVGLPTALAFHAAGQRVVGIDVDDRRLGDIANGRADLLRSDRDRLAAATAGPRQLWELSSDSSRLAQARTVIICVPTPVDRYFTPDLTMLRRACASVVRHAMPGQVLILTSTTYVGSTIELLVRPLAARGLRAGVDIAVAFSPERIDPGNDKHAHEDVPRVVGGATPNCTRAAAQALAAYALNIHEVSSPGTAEMTKLVENTFRAVNIALVNELADVGAALDLDIIEVIDAAATKPYGFMPFFPGPGVGGHCIPCDPHYLLWQLRKQRLNAPVIAQAMTGLAGRPHRVVERGEQTLAAAGRPLAGARILMIGVAYKPDVEDVRESTALEIIAELMARGALVAYHDPLVPTVRVPEFGELHSQREPAAFDADLVIVHTRHATQDLSWLRFAPAVLDATYRMTDLARRTVV